MRLSRRAFLERSLAAGLGLAATARLGAETVQRPAGIPLKHTFADLSRHFVFEYYAWYRMHPVEHWDQYDRHPPVDLASNYLPRLGAYDSAATKVMEQHAKWIRESGAGAINVSWWGPGSTVDRLVPALMDVMAAHDLRVGFHLEPYRDDHAFVYAEDVEYLVRRYGDARRWDCMLLLSDAAGRRGPVFKSFRTILPLTTTDCHGAVSDVKDYAGDDTWRRQTDRVRATFAADFDRVTLLADSLDWERTKRSGFDGIAVYDPYVHPNVWQTCAEGCTISDLVFSFNVNAGFDGIARRTVEPASCYVAPAVEPPAPRAYQWDQAADRAAVSAASERRIGETFDATVSLQTDPHLSNARKGFLLVYINSFNEWHEGDQFEPMKDWKHLTPEERAVGYHNPADGSYRLKTLKKRLAGVL